MIILLTGNTKKAEQILALFKKEGIILQHRDIEHHEPSGLTLQETALKKAMSGAKLLKKSVLVDDTGLFFEALDNFPGAEPKRVFEKLGYPGLSEKIKCLKNKKAKFICVLAYCEPRKKPLLFEGELKGTLLSTPSAPQGYDTGNYYPYDRFFIPKKEKQTLAWLRDKHKIISDHRTRACKKIISYLKKR